MKTKQVVLLILLLISSAIRAKVTYIWLPDPVLVFFLPLMLHLDDGYIGSVAIISGILRDGLYIDIPWISPLLFSIFGVVMLIYRSFVNVSLILPKILIFSVSVVVYYTAYLYVNGLGISFIYFRAILFTIIFAFLVELWLQRR